MFIIKLHDSFTSFAKITRHFLSGNLIKIWNYQPNEKHSFITRERDEMVDSFRTWFHTGRALFLFWTTVYNTNQIDHILNLIDDSLSEPICFNFASLKTRCSHVNGYVERNEHCAVTDNWKQLVVDISNLINVLVLGTTL